MVAPACQSQHISYRPSNTNADADAGGGGAGPQQGGGVAALVSSVSMRLQLLAQELNGELEKGACVLCVSGHYVVEWVGIGIVFLGGGEGGRAHTGVFPVDDAGPTIFRSHHQPLHPPRSFTGLLDLMASFPRAVAELDRLDLAAQDLKGACHAYTSVRV